ncbi:hypothetical protein E3E14_29265 [Streptomyces sp. ICN441]|uniref:hypothetical protein n=1 Tax=Streptomyces TaxID=1883 RepID=UPI00106C5AA4|nr:MULTISPECIES: hypothetical protein [Streptomyces]TFE38283.1 hypothetical protein E3E14_29265 [Streptomyces sp. ICN441]
MLAIALIPLPAAASEPSRAAPRADEPISLTVWPARTVLPSTARRHHRIVHVVNGTSSPQRIDTERAEFDQTTDGRIDFHPPGPVSAASWIAVSPSSFRLGPRETKEVRVDVTVPERPEPGERYVGVLFKTQPQPAPGNVQVAGALASQFLINVPGRATHRIVAKGIRAPRVAFWGPVRLTLPIRNAGNVHRSYTGSQRIVAEVGNDRLAFPEFTVLGNSRRTVTAQWPDPPLFCFCTASVTLATGNGTSVTRTARIVVIPLPQMIGLLAAALGLFLLTRKGVRYQRALLAAARQGRR